MIKFKPTTMAVLLVTGLAMGNAAQAELRYRIKDLGALAGSNGFSYGTGINAAGQVVGSTEIVGPNAHAFVTNSKGKMIDLGTLAGGFMSEGTSINASGQITGYNLTLPNSYTAIITDSSGKMVSLGTLGGDYSSGTGINASGQVTGRSKTVDNSFHAFITNNSGEMVDLGTLGGNDSSGTSINASGQVTGSAETTDAYQHAFVTNSSGKMVDLGTLGGNDSSGTGINTSGQVTGYAETADNYQHAFVTDSSGKMVDLGTLGGNTSFGTSINASGQVVGRADTVVDVFDGLPHSFVTDNGVMKDLNTLLVDSATGWVIDVNEINDSGQIAGTGRHTGINYHALLLTPINLAAKTNGDLVKLSESQKDDVKCGPITGAFLSQCSHSTTGTYTIIAKLSAATVAANGILIADLNADTQFGIAIGTFAFSGSLATADLNKSKLSPTALPGIWTQQRTFCSDPVAELLSGYCAKSKQVIDGTVKINTGNKKGLTVTLTGKNFVTETEDSNTGQQIYTDLCKANASNKSPLIEKATISIGDKTIPMPLKITCKVKKTTKNPIYSTSGPFELTNMAIKAELALTQ